MDVLKKVPVREQEPAVRAKNFEEVCLGYNEEEAVKEAERCLGCKNAQCIKGCPVAIDIPGFVSRIKEGEFEKAYEALFRQSAAVSARRKASAKANVSAVLKASRFPLVSWNGLRRIGQGSMGLCRRRTKTGTGARWP